MKPSLKFIALSGTTGVTENLYVYEYGNDMIIVDCGVGFPESEMLGVDLVIPDFSYIKQNASKLRGILISHGHEDHLGALPFLLKDVKTKIYATKLVGGFIEDKLKDYEVRGEISVFNPEQDVLSLGVFKVTPFRVSHSVPDGVGFCIDTPEGKIFHVPDYKFDWTPVDAKPFDVAKLATLSSQGALALASDSLGSNSPGYTESEKSIEEKVEGIMEKAVGQIFFTTISSNISRMQQAIRVAQKLGRKVVFIGRSTQRKAEVAKKLGYLFYPNDLIIVNPKSASKLPGNRLLYIISGSYGQPGSALHRLANDEHDFLHIDKNDTVIFSGDPAPPGSKTSVDGVVDRLFEKDVDVHYYDLQEDLHVSGHGSRKDIEMLFALVKPKYYIPIGGTIRHMRAYTKVAGDMGVRPQDVFELLPGESIDFLGGVAKKGKKIFVKSVLVDGLGIGDVGNVVLRDRQTLAKDGIAIVIVQFDMAKKEIIDNPEIISRGFVFEGKSGFLLDSASQELKAAIYKKHNIDAKVIKEVSVDFLERFMYEKTGRRPMILPVVVEV